MNSRMTLRIGSRKSRLALVQVEEVISLLKGRGIAPDFKRLTFETAGDKDKKTPLTKGAVDDFFTDTIDRALLRRKIDVAIHSAKDLPQKLDPGLEIYALTKALDDTDAWVSPVHFNELPKGARVGTSSFLRQRSICSLRPEIKLVNIRGTIGERLELIRQGKVDGIIVATCALKRLGLAHLIKDIFPWEGTPLQGQLAVVGRRGDADLYNMFKAIDVREHYGRVALVGAGPGDPRLITVHGVEALGEADCVFYDYLSDPSLLRYAPKAEHIYVGKRKGRHALPQVELSRQLRLKAMEGKRVVRLKGGDPLIFGRGAEEILYLRSYHIEVEIIPGVSSATGIPSRLGIPLTARGVSSRVAFVSAHGEDEGRNSKSDLRIPDSDSIVFLMGLTKITQIVKALRAKKWPSDTPIVIVSKGTRRDEVVVTATLATIERVVRKEKPEPPALIVVGKTVDLYRPPLHQKTILFLGTHPREYRSLGRLIHLPMIQISPVSFSVQERKAFLSVIEESDLVLLTSEYAVEHFFAFLEKHNARQTVGTKDFVVIGGHTAQALLNHGVHPKLIASEETSEGVFRALKKNYKLKGKRIVFPRSSLSNPFLKMALTKEGARVSEVPVYQNTKPKKRLLPKENIQTIVFTSPSTVVNFIKDYGKIPASWEILCKGPVSQKALKKFGYEAKVIVN